MNWQTFLQDSPERVVRVIEDGPFPLKEYGSETLTYADKKKGIMRYKGGEGRGHVRAKQGWASIVYFDPAFCEGKFASIDVPDEVMARHSKDKVLAEFKKI